MNDVLKKASMSPLRKLIWILAEIPRRLRAYWRLIKSLQTAVLLITGVAGYVSGCCLHLSGSSLVGVVGSLFLAISGSTVLNMVYDRDIDAIMPRTCRRPLPAGTVSYAEALTLGLVLAVGGVGWALAMAWLYGLIVLAGLLLDVVVYTIWLKRRTPYSILIGGLSGGMPALAGRTLAVGQVDLVGILLALAILFWIPIHIMTFSIKYASDYSRAQVPTFPSMYGVTATRRTIAFSSLLGSGLMLSVAWNVGVEPTALWILGGMSLVLLGLVALLAIRPSDKLNFGLFKYASLYMLTAMLILIVQAF